MKSINNRIDLHKKNTPRHKNEMARPMRKRHDVESGVRAVGRWACGRGLPAPSQPKRLPISVPYLHQENSYEAVLVLSALKWLKLGKLRPSTTTTHIPLFGM